MRGATRDLRKQATAGKRLLWQALRDRRLAGRKFRRQHPIGQFVVDFCCLEEMLAIEIDGSAHAGREEPDFERQRILEAYRLLAREEGVFCEPASAACVAGLLKTARTPGHGLDGKRVVCVITGDGLKDPDTALSIEAEMTDVPADLTAVERAMGLAGS